MFDHLWGSNVTVLLSSYTRSLTPGVCRAIRPLFLPILSAQVSHHDPFGQSISVIRVVGGGVHSNLLVRTVISMPSEPLVGGGGRRI